MISHMNRITVPLLTLMFPPRPRPWAWCDSSGRIRIWGLAAPLPALKEGADGGLVGLAVVAGDVRPGHPHRIAEEVVLVQRLPAGEGRDAGVPDQPEQPDPLGPAQRGRLQVGLDVGRGGTGHVRLGRG